MTARRPSNPSPPFRGARAPRILPVAGLLALAALAGCGDDTYKGVKRERLVIDNTSLNDPFQRRSAPPPDPSMATFGGDPTVGMGAPGTGRAPGMGEEQDKDRIKKADIYFKFKWAQESLVTKIVPNDLQGVVDDAKARAASLMPDHARSLIMEITELLQKGLDAHTLEAELNRSGIDPDTVDWRGSAGIGAPGKMETDTRLRRAREYARLNHASPSILQWDKFREAGRLIDKLEVLVGQDEASKSAAERAARTGAPPPR